MKMTVLLVAALSIVALIPAGAISGASGGNGCSIRCTNGASCSASGYDCSCSCVEVCIDPWGLVCVDKRAVCTCGNVQMG